MQGVLLGNPSLGSKIMDESRVDYFYSHGFIDRTLYEKLKSCNSYQRQLDCYRAVSIYTRMYIIYFSFFSHLKGLLSCTNPTVLVC